MKTECQPKWFINNPPTAGPSMPPMATIQPLSPRAFPLRAFLNIVAIIACAFESIIEAPIASKHLDATSMPYVGDMKLANAPRPNIVNPNAYNLFLGKMSPNFPKNGKNTVNVSMYPTITHWICERVIPKSFDIGYNAKFTVEESSMPIKLPTAVTINIVHFNSFVVDIQDYYIIAFQNSKVS